MLPAQQRLIADDPLGLRADDGLIGDEELVGGKRVAQIVLELLAALRAGEHFGAEEAVDAAPVALGGIEREIGVAHQRLGVMPVLGRDRDADRAADADRRALDRIGLRQVEDHAPREIAEPRAIGLIGQDHLEFVAAQASDQPVAADRALQALRHLLEQRVAGVVAERVVDGLEAIEIEQEQRAGARRDAARAQRLFER